jgi:hypothetical protein
MTWQGIACSQNSMYGGAITTSKSKRETNGKQPKKQAKASLNQQLCSSASQIPPQPFKQ